VRGRSVSVKDVIELCCVPRGPTSIGWWLTFVRAAGVNGSVWTSSGRGMVSTEGLDNAQPQGGFHPLLEDAVRASTSGSTRLTVLSRTEHGAVTLQSGERTSRLSRGYLAGRAVA
jgi:hypothetical protein